MSLAIVGGVEGVPDGDAGAVALWALLRVRSDMMGITEGHERMADMEIESEWTEIGYLESGGRFREKDNCGTNGIGTCNGDIGRSIGRR